MNSKNTLLLLAFLLSQTISTAQEIEINGDWLLSNMPNIKFSFSENNKLSIQQSRTFESTTKTFELIRENKLIHLFENNQPFDILEIINLEQDILTIYQNSTLDTLKLLDSKKTVSRADYHDFMSAAIIDYYSPYLENGIGHKRFYNFFTVHPELSCCKIVNSEAKQELSDERLKFLDLIQNSIHFQKYSKSSFWPKTMTNDTLTGLILPEKIDLKMVRNRTCNNLPDSLIGTWIVLEDKAKFDALLKKEAKTIFIGHQHILKILPGNKCSYSTEDFSNTGIICLENIEGINMLNFGTGIIQQDGDESMIVPKYPYSYFQVTGKLTVHSDTYMTLNTRYFENSIFSNTELYFIKID